ncbi:uncharacterized protein LOC118403209 isoform X2 [Branchiostoma floridae]|uniref:Uncharacterized protein LOC118403209 isoform X2 n=1 Tax=Branchiostoma floridae TaxID=7739 RepID=A0A9J7HGP5_BRAFL|nr:uncharacterized protein LOC118403209 isoform X2 [Branchiostoma floridae]
MDSDSDQEDPDPATFCQGVSKTSTPTKRTSGLQNKDDNNEDFSISNSTPLCGDSYSQLEDLESSFMGVSLSEDQANLSGMSFPSLEGDLDLSGLSFLSFEGVEEDLQEDNKDGQETEQGQPGDLDLSGLSFPSFEYVEKDLQEDNKDGQETEQGQPGPGTVDLGIKLLETSRCTEHCAYNFSPRSLEEVHRAYRKIKTAQRVQWIAAQLQVSIGKKKIKHFLLGEKVCAQCWRKLQGISIDTYYKGKEMKLKQKSPKKHGNKGRWKPPIKTQKAEAFIANFVKYYGQHQPNKNQQHMPTSMSRKDVWIRYKRQQETREDETIQRSTFYRLLRKRFSSVKFPKESRHGHCKDCNMIRDQCRHARSDSEVAEVNFHRDSHASNYKGARQKYYKHNQKAIDSPDKYISLMMDGMDQKSTRVPHFGKGTKDTIKVTPLPLYLVGVLLASPALLFVFLDANLFPHGSNLSVTCLSMTFLKMLQSGIRLGTTLYIQMDNCYRECKSKYILFFCWLLVKRKIFKKVKVSYMMVGHTHDKIDQRFSVLTRSLEGKNITTVPKLCQEIQNTFKEVEGTGGPTVIEELFDVSSWMDGYLCGYHNHTEPRAFLFKLGPDGNSVLQFYRMHSNQHKNWTILPNFLKNEPPVTSIPQLLAPDFGRQDLKQLRTDLEKCIAELEIDDPENIYEWRRFFQRRQALEDKWSRRQQPRTTWPLKQLQAAIQRQRPTVSQPSLVRDILRARMEAEAEHVEVYTGYYKGAKKPVAKSRAKALEKEYTSRALDND